MACVWNITKKPSYPNIISDSLSIYLKLIRRTTNMVSKTKSHQSINHEKISKDYLVYLPLLISSDSLDLLDNLHACYEHKLLLGGSV